MKNLLLIKIVKSHNPVKKYDAVFQHDNRTKTISFGASGYTDFIKSGGDEERKKRYLNRHRKNEDWTDPMKAGTLSKFVLWNRPSLKESIKDYKKHFNL
jgi:hypothetical protein